MQLHGLSNLCEQKFNININTSHPSPSNLSCSIPEGSILAPLLFLFCLNDLPPSFASNSFMLMILQIVFQNKSIIEIEKQLIRDLSSLCDLFVNNK